MAEDRNFVLSNLPGLGIPPRPGVPNPVPPPLRVRATCDDGSRGETELIFPAYGQAILPASPVEWGKSTEVPVQISLELPRQISQAEELQAKVHAVYASGAPVDRTSRQSGTGYLSSAPAFVTVDGDGKVSFNSSAADFVNTGLPAPMQVSIRAENDGVIANKVLKLASGRELKGQIIRVDGASPEGAVVRVVAHGYGEWEVPVNFAGAYSLKELPLGGFFGAVYAYDKLRRSIGSRSFSASSTGTTVVPEIRHEGAGKVRFRVLDETGTALQGVPLSVGDALRMALPDLALPYVRSDSGGLAEFEAVASGFVAPLVGAMGFSVSPSFAMLAPGGVTEFTVRKQSLAADQVSELRGKLRLMPTNRPAAGMSVVLSLQGSPVARQQTDGGGAYVLRDLTPSTLYTLEAVSGDDVLHSAPAATGPAGSVTTLNLDIVESAGLNGAVYQPDGQTPVADARVQISSFDAIRQEWRVVKTTLSDGQGLFRARGLAGGRTRVDASTLAGSAAFAELELANGGAQDVALRLEEKKINTKLRVRALVGGLPLPLVLPVAAQLYVKNDACPAACLLGSTSLDAGRFESEALPVGKNSFELRLGGRSLTFAVDVGPATDGQSIEWAPSFALDEAGELKLAQQRSLYSFDAFAGQRIDAIVLGLARNHVPAAYAVKIQLYGPDGALLREGYGNDPGQVGLPAQWAIRQFPAPTTGRHTLVFSALTDEARNIGGFGLLLNLDHLPGAMTAWAAEPHRLGASVGGRVLRSDGSAAMGLPLLVQAGVADGVQLIEQVVTGADGGYRHENLPLGPVQVSYSDAGLVLAKGEALLEAEHEAKVLDLQLLAKTTVAATVTLSQDMRPVGSIKLQLSDALTNQREHEIVFAPDASSAVKEFPAAGANFTLAATHPRNPRYRRELSVAGQDGAAVPVELSLLSGGIKGQVLSGTQDRVAGLAVRALDSKGKILAESASEELGDFRLNVLPDGERVRLVTQDDGLGVTAEGEVTVIRDADVLAPALVLPTGAVDGRVLLANGAPVGGLYLLARLDNGKEVGTSTDDLGRFSFPRLPSGQAVVVTATHPAMGAVLSQAVSPLLGQRVTMPDLVFPLFDGLALTGRVRSVSGKPLAASIMVTNVLAGGETDPPGAEAFVRYGYSDEAGVYRVEDVPKTSRQLRVEAQAGELSAAVQEQTLVLAPGDNLRTLPDFVFAEMSDLRVRFVDAGGKPILTRRPQGECSDELWLWGPGIGENLQELPQDLNGLVFSGAPAGASYHAELRQCQYTLAKGDVLVPSDSSEAKLDVVIPMLRGKLSYADGVPAPYASVWMLQWDAEGMRSYVQAEMNPGQSEAGGKDEPSAYLFFGGFGRGDYELAGQDGSGVEVRKSGNFASLPNAVIDLQLPPTATVQGCVTRADGQAAPAGRINLLVNGDLRRDAVPAGGCYRFEHVPSGSISLFAYEGVNESEELKAVSQFDLQVTVEGQLVQRSLQYLPTGNLVTLATGSDGRPAAGREITVKPQALEVAAGLWGKQLTSNASGLASFELLPGPYGIDAWNWGLGQTASGSDAARVTAGSLKELSLPYANALRLDLLDGSDDAIPTVPPGAVGFRFNSSADVSSTGNSNYFAGLEALHLRVDGMPLPGALSARLAPGEREMSIGPFEYAGKLSIHRRLFVPPGGGYGRMLESLSNNSAQPITVTLAAQASGPSRCAPIAISLPQNSDARGYVSYRDCEAAVAHVYAGAGATALKPVKVETQPGFATYWKLTVPAGQTVGLLHFAVIGAKDAQAAVAAQADALARQLDGHMLDGLTADDKLTIRNFVVGP